MKLIEEDILAYVEQHKRRADQLDPRAEVITVRKFYAAIKRIKEQYQKQ